MRIQHNIPAMNAYRNFKTNNSGLSKNLEKLSSGYKINRAGDDAAGLAISEKMRAQISGLEVASKNAKDGISLVQTAEGALTEVHDMLNRMVTLAEQSANGTYSDDVDRAQLQKEVDQLREEINRIADSANFNGIKLLDGSMDSTNAIAATSTTTVTTAYGKFTAFATSDIADIATSGGKYIDGTLGSDTIFHKAAPNAGNSSFTINLNNYSMTKAGDFTVEIAGALGTSAGSPLAISTSVTVSVTADDLEYDALDGAALAQKVYESVVGTDANGSEVHQITMKNNNGTATYNVSYDGKTLKFDAVDEGEMPVDLKVTMSNVQYSATDGTGSKTGAVVSFSWESGVDEAVKLAMTGGTSGDNTLKFGVKAEQKVVAVLTAANLTIGSLAVDHFTAGGAKVNGATVSKEADGSIKITNDTGSAVTIDDDTEVTLTYKNKNVTLKLKELDTSNFTSSVTLADNDTKTIAVGSIEAALKKAFYATAAAYGSGDTVTITFPGIAASTYASGSLPVGYEIRNANGSATLGGTDTITDGSKSVTYTIYDGAGSGANKVGSFTVDLNAVSTKFAAMGTAAYYGTEATVKAAHFTLDDSTNKIDAKLTTKVGGAGTGDYNTSTEVNSLGVDTAATRLASTMLDTTGSVFADKIKDGAALKIGDETYIFAVGASSTLKDSENGKLVDLKDIEIASGATALASDDLKTALERLTVAAKDNAMFGVGYDKKNDRMTLVEREDYYNGSNVLLNTKKAIADQLAWGEVKSKNGQTETTSTTAAVVAKDLTLQIGDTAESFNQLTVSIKDMHTSAMGVTGSDGKVVSGKSLADIDVSTQDGAQAAVDIIKSAINYVSDMRGTLGATQNRLDHTINNLSVMVENITDAESTIRDTDIAEEMMTYTKNSILNQAAQAMLAQANQLPQGVLQLLQ